MKILYVASGIPVPGALGGSTHVREVAAGLAARGHQVHVIAASTARANPAALLRPQTRRLDGFTLHQIDLPKIASALADPLMLRIARAVQPDAIIERYYNFAGGGVRAAQRLGIPLLLEVNALIIDPPAVRKRRIDDALGGPLRRLALAQCRAADRIITPLHTTVPEEIPRERIVELPWGAAVERFVHVVPTWDNPPTIVFLGSFRGWHGVCDAVRACGTLLNSGRRLHGLLIGDGPERAAAEQLASRWPGSFTFAGAVAYEEVPALLGRAAIGVAPFRTDAHPALQAAGFFWSPLKVYEYMAAGLPVVLPDIAPLHTIVRDSGEGALYAEGDLAALAQAIARLLDDPPAARAMGERGRTRVTAHYSWAAHCAALEQLLVQVMHR